MYRIVVLLVLSVYMLHGASFSCKKAFTDIEKTVCRDKKLSNLDEELADIYLYLWDIDKANNAIDFALNINTESATWNYLKWFVILSEWKDLELAIKYLEKSNSLMPNNPEVLRNLWWAYTSNKQITKGIFILKRALNIHPNDFLITEDLAMALISNWDLKEWNELLKKIWKGPKEVKI